MSFREKLPADPGADRGTEAPADPPARWRPHLGLTASLLAVWFGVSFGITFFARDLAFDFFGWPFSFWVGAQGALVAYWFITWIYARRMNRLEAQAATPEADRQH